MILKKGDIIGLVTPAGPISKEKLDKSIANMLELGFEPVYFESVMAQYGYFAGTEEERIHELETMFANPEIAAIICVRGGYGTTTIIDKLDYELIARNPKPVMGFSDITALLFALHKYAGIPCYHGIVGGSEFTSYTKKCFVDLFMNDAPEVKIESYKFNLPDEIYTPYIITPGTARGRLIGGNLALLTSLIGTPFDIDWTNKIVFIEEINEAPYAIDRMLTQLILAGKFKGVRAVIFGIFNGCEESSANSFSLKETLTQKMKDFDFPCAYGFSFGHIENQAIFPINAKAEFSTENFSFTIIRENHLQ